MHETTKAGEAKATRGKQTLEPRLKGLDRHAALLVVDVQRGFDDPAWGPRNNPSAEANVAKLIAAWRVAGGPIFHTIHDSPASSGRLRRGTPGNEIKPEAAPLASEKVYRKSVNSAFIGTTLEVDLRTLGIKTVVIVGLTTNHCISTTARMAGNLGFTTFVLSDATATFERASLGGRVRSADDVHHAALCDLQDEFAEIVDTDAVIAALAIQGEAHVSS